MDCTRCGNCCHSQTGWLVPADLRAIAEFLNISQRQLISRYLVIDYLAQSETGYTFVWAPVRVNEFTGTPLVTPGQRVPWRYSEEYAPCIFWQTKGCSIHQVKPLECKLYGCGTSDGVLQPSRSHIAMQWDQSEPEFAALHRQYNLAHCRRNLEVEDQIREIALAVEKGSVTSEEAWDKIDELRMRLD